MSNKATCKKDYICPFFGTTIFKKGEEYQIENVDRDMFIYNEDTGKVKKGNIRLCKVFSDNFKVKKHELFSLDGIRDFKKFDEYFNV